MPVVATPLSILLAILSLGLVLDLSKTAIVDMFKMTNSFFPEKVVPESSHLIDKITYDDGDVMYHAVCPTCKQLAGSVKKNLLIRCARCAVTIDLKDPSYNEYFVEFDVRDELQELVENNHEYFTEVVTGNRQSAPGTLTDIQDGDMYKKFVQKLPTDQKESYLTTIFNSDGSPVFKSSKFSMWPIQIIPNEIP